MKTFNEWAQIHELTDSPMPGSEAPNPPSAAPMPGEAQPPNPMQQAGPNVDDMKVKNMVKTRLAQLFDQLEGYKMSRSKSMELLQTIMQEFRQQQGLTPNQMRAAATNQAATTAQVDQPAAPTPM